MPRVKGVRCPARALQVALSAAALSFHSGSTNAQTSNGVDLTRYTRANGAQEMYFAAGDDVLVKAFELLNSAWNQLATAGIHLTRGFLDCYLPIELRNMGHKAANAMEQRIADHVFAQRTPLNLVPSPFEAMDPSNKVSVGDKQFLRFPYFAAELLRWFPKRAAYRAAAASIARATAKFMYVDGGAVRPMANVSTGVSDPGWVTYTMSLGWNAEAMAELTRITGDPSFFDSVEPKLDWVWSHLPNAYVPLLAEEFTQSANHYAGCSDAAQLCNRQASDSDTLYYVRSLFAIWEKLKLTRHHAQARKYRKQAISIADHWFRNAWLEEHELFARKMNFDGTVADRRFYADAKYNIMYVLVWAYKASGDVKYINRLKRVYDSLLHRSNYRHGMIDQLFVEGVGNGQLDPGQHIFVDILVEAFKATRDTEWVDKANALALLSALEGRAAWGGRVNDYLAGAIFLKLARAKHKLWRLETTFGLDGCSLLVRRGSSRGATVFEKSDLKTPIVELFLPQDRYYVSGTGGSTWTSVNLDSNKELRLAAKNRRFHGDCPDADGPT